MTRAASSRKRAYAQTARCILDDDGAIFSTRPDTYGHEPLPRAKRRLAHMRDAPPLTVVIDPTATKRTQRLCALYWQREKPFGKRLRFRYTVAELAREFNIAFPRIAWMARDWSYATDPRYCCYRCGRPIELRTRTECEASTPTLKHFDSCEACADAAPRRG